MHIIILRLCKLSSGASRSQVRRWCRGRRRRILLSRTIRKKPQEMEKMHRNCTIDVKCLCTCPCVASAAVSWQHFPVGSSKLPESVGIVPPNLVIFVYKQRQGNSTHDVIHVLLIKWKGKSNTDSYSSRSAFISSPCFVVKLSYCERGTIGYKRNHKNVLKCF